MFYDLQDEFSTCKVEVKIVSTPGMVINNREK